MIPTPHHATTTPDDVVGGSLSAVALLLEGDPRQLAPVPLTPALRALRLELEEEAQEWLAEHRARVSRGELLSAEGYRAVELAVDALRAERVLVRDDAARLRIDAGPVQLAPTRADLLTIEEV